MINHAEKVISFKDRLLRTRRRRQDGQPSVRLPVPAAGNKGNIISLATGDDRTIFFDFLPVAALVVRGFETRFQLYTVPGQVPTT